jgi:prepilin-type N-terminal cleavage/methylation domain-containing protein
LQNKIAMSNSAGFTLIELLVVMAILGVLAVIVFIAINPGERQAQARDTGRISAISQFGRAIESYYTSHDGSFPDEATWAQGLLDTGELSTFPSGVAYTISGTSNCTSFVQPGADPTYCYDLDATNGAIVFATAEAGSHTSKCTAPEATYFVFSTSDGRGGTICSNGDPSAWASGSMTYVD